MLPESAGLISQEALIGVSLGLCRLSQALLLRAQNSAGCGFGPFRGSAFMVSAEIMLLPVGSSSQAALSNTNDNPFRKIIPLS